MSSREQVINKAKMMLSGLLRRTTRRMEYRSLSRRNLIDLLDGYIHMVHEGATPDDFDQAMIAAYCRTGGVFQAYIHDLETKAQKHLDFQEELVIEIPNRFGTSASTADEIHHQWQVRQPATALSLADEGYEIMPILLDENTIQRLADAAPSFRYKIKTVDEVTTQGDYAATLSDNVVTAYADTNQLVDHECVRELYLDADILAVVRKYLDCPRIRLRDINMWFTRAQTKASSSSAQYYHFDQGSVKWVKVFIFLTHVDRDSGPHSAVLGSHKPQSKPLRLLSRGYVRIPDKDIHVAHGKHREHQFCIERGGVLLADTNAWHKGTPVNKGYRLVLEFEYTACVEQCHWPIRLMN